MSDTLAPTVGEPGLPQAGSAGSIPAANNSYRIKKGPASKCSWCGELILKGAPFTWWPSVNDDGVPNGSCSMHPECDEAYCGSYRETFKKYRFIRGMNFTKPESLDDSA